MLLLLCAWGLAVVACGPLDVRRYPPTGRSVEFVDREGGMLGTVAVGDRSLPVPLARVAPSLRIALVATEDARFAYHGAVDPLAVASALVSDVRARRVVRGASTIAMQVARAIRPVPATFAGKLAETAFAERLVAGSSRDALLEAYANRVPMGANIVGVEAAARTYFGIAAADVDLAQAAVLAALPNDPVGLDPYAHPAALRERTIYVLHRVAAYAPALRREAERAVDERIALRPRTAGIAAAPHLVFRLAASDDGRASRVRTTIDGALQRYAEAQVRDVLGGLAANGAQHGAVLVIDNATSDVLAYVGSPDYFDDAHSGRNDGVQALRQPGSTLKPFLYELAFERGTLAPTSILLDARVAYALPNARVYEPADYSGRFYGPVRARTALASSLNVPAVRTLERLGVAAFLTRLRALGFDDLTHDDAFYGLGLTLGAGETTLWQLGRAYEAIANDGILRPLRTRDADPRIALAPVAPRDAAPWRIVTDMLADRYARAPAFGADSVLALPFPAAVKTGTSSDLRDTWTIGFTRRYTVATWVGNFGGGAMHGISGVSGAGPLWNRMMLHLHEREEPPPFAPPAGYARRAFCARPPGALGARCREPGREFVAADPAAAPVARSLGEAPLPLRAPPRAPGAGFIVRARPSDAVKLRAASPHASR